MTKCPPGLEPFRYVKGDPFPLFVPESMLVEARARSPKLWIVAAPPVLPIGRPIEWRDFP